MDVWLLFGLTLPFISFVLSILEELVQHSRQDEPKVNNLFYILLWYILYLGMDHPVKEPQESREYINWGGWIDEDKR